MVITYNSNIFTNFSFSYCSFKYNYNDNNNKNILKVSIINVKKSRKLHAYSSYYAIML